jgi:hypothetical protein
VVFHVECNKIFNKFYKPVPILIDNHRMIVELDYDGHAITAVIGADFQRGILGRGHTAPDALRALAAAIRTRGLSIAATGEMQSGTRSCEVAARISTAKRGCALRF